MGTMATRLIIIVGLLMATVLLLATAIIVLGAQGSHAPSDGSEMKNETSVDTISSPARRSEAHLRKVDIGGRRCHDPISVSS